MAYREELEREIERGNYSRAAYLAASQGLLEAELERLRTEALWRMAVVYRNAPGTRLLAEEYGLSKQDLRDLLERLAREKASKGDAKSLAPCYDLRARTHLSFEEWMGRLLESWEKLPAP